MSWIETDLKPDDVLAIYILPPARYYVVGEGDINNKYQRMNKYCQLMSNNEAIVIQGIGSENCFHFEGKEFTSLDDPECVHQESYLENLIQFSLMENPIMFCLKPMHELMIEYIKNTQKIASLVSNVTLYISNVFNLRCVHYKHEEELILLLGYFKKVCIYENYYTIGLDSMINKINEPKLYQIIKYSDNEYFDTFLRLTKYWNQYLNNLVEKNKLLKEKIISGIDFNFTLGSIGLAAIYRYHEPIPITNLSFDKLLLFDKSSKPTIIHLYMDISKKEIVEHVIELIEAKSHKSSNGMMRINS